MKTSAEFRKACPYAWMLVKRAASWPMLPELRPFPEDVSGLMGTGSGAMPDTPAAPAAAPVLVRPFSPWINPDGTPYGTAGPGRSSRAGEAADRVKEWWRQRQARPAPPPPQMLPEVRSIPENVAGAMGSGRAESKQPQAPRPQVGAVTPWQGPAGPGAGFGQPRSEPASIGPRTEQGREFARQVPSSPWINPDGTPYGTRGPSGQKPQPAQAQDPRPEQQAQAQGIKTDPRKLQSGTRAYSDTGYGIMDRPPKMMTPGLWTPGKLTAPRPAGAPAR